jgi:hypothetical protein
MQGERLQPAASLEVQFIACSSAVFGKSPVVHLAFMSCDFQVTAGRQLRVRPGDET